MKHQDASDNLFFEIKVLGWPLPLREYRFDKVRKWRFDLAYPEKSIAIEIEGGVFLRKGGHTSGVGYTKNLEKYNAATLAGWKLFRFTPAHIKSGYAREILEQALK